MDFSLAEEQEMLKKMSHDFLSRECPLSQVKAIIKDEKGYSPDLWQKMKELGWLGIAFPEEYGGMGGTFLDLIVLCEEMGYACFPSPFLASIADAGLIILDVGTDKQKQKLLPMLAGGGAIFTLALTESEVRYEPKTIHLSATLSKDKYIINGTKLFVPYAHVADYMLCTTSTDAARNGITLFIINTKSSGIHCTVLKSMAIDKQCMVVFDKLVVDKEDILGKVNKGWAVVERAMQRGVVARCAEMVGGAQRVLDMAIAYAKDRQQFSRPIGSFQAIQHQCADMAFDVKVSRLLTYQAAWKISKQLPCSKEAAMAKAWVSEAYVRVTYFGAKIHGAIGLTTDHDIPLYFKQARASEPVFGDDDFHLATVACELGL